MCLKPSAAITPCVPLLAIDIQTLGLSQDASCLFSYHSQSAEVQGALSPFRSSMPASKTPHRSLSQHSWLWTRQGDQSCPVSPQTHLSCSLMSTPGDKDSSSLFSWDHDMNRRIPLCPFVGNNWLQLSGLGGGGMWRHRTWAGWK